MLSSKSINLASRFLGFSKGLLAKTPTAPINPYIAMCRPVVPTGFTLKSLTYSSCEFFSLYSAKRYKPCLPHKFRNKLTSPKKRSKRKATNYKLTNHRGLLKRIKIVKKVNTSYLLGWS
jgi:hypothetical protein